MNKHKTCPKCHGLTGFIVKITKKRELTENQLIVLTMRQQGYEIGQIAHRLGLQIQTIRAKEQALKKGLTKNAYVLPPELQQPQTDIFEL